MPIGIILLIVPLYFLSIGANGLYKGELAVSTHKGLRGNFSMFLSALLLIIGLAGFVFGYVANADNASLDFYGLKVEQTYAANLFAFSIIIGILFSLVAVITTYIGRAAVPADNKIDVKSRVRSIIIALIAGTILYELFNFFAKYF